MTAYYNENDKFCAQWLRNLIAAGEIAPGDVDERDIWDVAPDDLKDYTQCHFFAGIGVWSDALRYGGWPDDRAVWTGSCPCQPFSAAGKGLGFADERHLWPAWFHLIAECRPAVIFGEQVANGAGLSWIDLVHTDMEGSSYSIGALDLCAAGNGAPHIRQRLGFVAHTYDAEWRAGGSGRDFCNRPQAGRHQGHSHASERRSAAQELAYSGREGLEGWSLPESRREDELAAWERSGPWSKPSWLCHSDGLYRPTGPGTFTLVNEYSTRVGELRAYGNAIVKETWATFIGCYIDEAEERINGGL